MHIIEHDLIIIWFCFMYVSDILYMKNKHIPNITPE